MTARHHTAQARIDHALGNLIPSLHRARSGLSGITELVADSIHPDHAPTRLLVPADTACLLDAARALIDHIDSLALDLEDVLGCLHSDNQEEAA